MTKTDGLCVLLLANARRSKPSHSIPPSSHSSCNRMATSDWPLLRVTSIVQAGGAARCPAVVAMAADKLLSWMRGSKYTVHLYIKHLSLICKEKQGVSLISWASYHNAVIISSCNVLGFWYIAVLRKDNMFWGDLWNLRPWCWTVDRVALFDLSFWP